MKNNQVNITFHFGRNPLSIIIVLAALGILFLIFFPIYSYSSTWNNNNVTPFETYYNTSESNDSETVQAKKQKRLSTVLPAVVDLKTKDASYEIYKMNGKDFDLFDLEINCTAYTNTHDVDSSGSSTDNAKFTFTVRWTDKTTEQLGVNFLIPFDGKKDIKLHTCFAADWVGFCKYQTSTNVSQSIITKASTESDEDYTGASFSSTISGLEYFPAKANTFPVPVSVKTPDLFVYIEFKYQHNGAKTRVYVLKYTFDEYNPNAKAGGIYSK